MRGGAPGGQQGLPGALDRRRRRVAGPGAGIRRVRRGGVERAGGGEALGPLPAPEGRAGGDQPGEGTRGQHQGHVARYLPELLRGEEGGRGDEGEDHVPGRADAGRVAEGLLHGGEQGSDGDQHGRRAGERGDDQGDGQPGRHPEDDAEDGVGPAGVRQVVPVQRAERSRHRVHDEVEAVERVQQEIRDGGGDHHAQRGLVPDLRGALQPQDTGDRQFVDG